MTSERLATRVGTVSLAVLAAAIVFFVFVYGRIEWGVRDRVRVYFHHTGGLKEGAPMIVAGRTIGHVESIALAPHAPLLGGDDGVVAIVAIERGAAERVGKGGDVFVSSRGALSERYLEIGPAPEPGAPFHDGDEVVGRDPPTLDSVLNRAWTNMLAFQAFNERMQPEVAALREQVTAMEGNFDAVTNTLPAVGVAAGQTAPLIADANDVIAAVTHIREVDLGGEAGLARATALVDHARTTVAHARAAIANLRAQLDALQVAVDQLRARIDAKSPQLAARLDDAIARGKSALDKVDPMLAVVAEIVDRVQRGEGTVGKLANDPEFPEDAKELGKIMKREPWRIVGHPLN